MLQFLLSLLLVITVAACAPVTRRMEVDQGALDTEARFQRTLAVAGVVADHTRLYRVSYPLLKASKEFCKDKTRNALGALILNRYALGALADAAESQGIGEEFKVLTVATGSAAQAAGVRANDVIVSINNWTPPVGKESIAAFIERATELLKPGTPLTAVIRRGAETMTINVTPEPICIYQVQLADQTAVNAAADGDKVMVTRGMMRFAVSDEELALVISHEISHNAMGHIDAQRGNRMVGAVMEGLLAALLRTRVTGGMADAMGRAFSQDFEAEADYVGLYIMARANVPIGEAPKFWRRMAAESPANISGNHLASHPASSYRMLALDKTVAEIETKRAAGRPLTPEMKPSDK